VANLLISSVESVTEKCKNPNLITTWLKKSLANGEKSLNKSLILIITLYASMKEKRGWSASPLSNENCLGSAGQSSRTLLPDFCPTLERTHKALSSYGC